jgi:hypothetical protein
MVSRVQELLKSGRKEDLWQLCCGFIDLSLDQFMAIQNSLMLEQIELLKKCELGKRIFRGTLPASIEDFRRNVPLTTYVDYCPDLLEKRENILPAKPIRWIQTSGKGGEYPFKWIPVTERFWEEAGIDFGAVAIFGSCRNKGEVVIKPGMKILYAASSPPTLTNAVAHRLSEDMNCEFLPDLDEAESLRFEPRVEKGFKLALSEGINAFFGLGGVLVAVGNRFNQSSGNHSKSKLLTHPLALLRVSQGLLKSKRAGRRMVPKDLWKLTYIASMGTDSMVFRDKIKELWGRMPLNVYGNTETTIVATQTWDYRDMVFFPNLNFLEFIPQEDDQDSYNGRLSRYKTILMDETQPGKTYELVISNFHGGALVRYRTGDLVRITSLRNDALGIKLPQMINEGRIDDLIDLGFMRLNERVIWQALENTGIPYREWTAHKEISETPRLHLYIELAEGYYTSSQEVAERLYKAIKKLDDGLYVYADISSIESLINFKPIEVTLLPEGNFSKFKQARQAEGVSTSGQQPPHVNPSDNDLVLLGEDSKSVPEKWAEKMLQNRL